MRLYDRESANRLIPTVERLLRDIVEKRRELAAIQRQLHGRHASPAEALLLEDDGHLSRRFEQLDEELFNLISEVQGMGAVVKDLEMGLVDFPAIVDRQPVYLCWKLGETEIGFYHGVEEGFYGRKPLTLTRFKKHILVCTKAGEGHCGACGGLELFMSFRQQARQLGLMDDILITQCGCTGQHETGPTVIVHPDGIWYHHLGDGDVETILREHISEGRPVERLINLSMACGADGGQGCPHSMGTP